MTNDQSAICPVPHRSDPDRPRRCGEGFAVCRGCLERLRDAVQDLPGLWKELEDALHPRNDGAGGAGPVTGTSETPLPINLTVAEHRTHIPAVLLLWCRLVADERARQLPDSGDVDVLCRWLEGHVDWCAERGWASEMVQEVGHLAGYARHLIDPQRTKKVELGPCVTADCDGLILGTFREDDEEPWTAYCPRCGTEWTTEQWYNLRRRMERQREREAS